MEPKRGGFLENLSENEKQIMSDHFEYLKKLMEDDKLQLAGPVLDLVNPMGIIVFKTTSEREAEELINDDPSVKNKLQEVIKLKPFRLSLFNLKP
ncbi:MAG: YciI family protein [Candidatus Lokiarchaeota archaeon]